ncbi:MAG: OsmC family protein [Chloroflexota bacterium]
MSIAESIARASAYLTAHPDEARYRDGAAHARLVAGLAVETTGPTGELLRTDMPQGIGGTASAPSPGWYLRAATASCVVALIAIRAAATGILIGAVDVRVDSESDDRGILGLDPDIVAGALSMKIVVSIAAVGQSQAALDELGRWAIDHCPVSDTVRRAVPVEVEIHAT